MLSTLNAAALIGIDAIKVTVETNVTGGIPSFTVVGLPDNAIRESRERILTAIRNSGFTIPPKKITVNLAPRCRALRASCLEGMSLSGS